MKLLLLFLLIFATTTYAQKPAIDSQAIVKWPFISWHPSLSDDGNYLLYTITNVPQESVTLVIQKTDSSWKQEFAGVGAAAFAAEQQVVFQRNDTLFFLSLLSKELTYVAKVMNYKLPEGSNRIAYQLTEPANDLVLQNLLTGKKRRFTGITAYNFDDKAMVLVIQTADTLQWIDIRKDRVNLVWPATSENTGKTISSHVLDAAGTQLAFMLQQKSSTGTINTLWYYKPDTNNAVMIAASGADGIAQGLSVSNTAPSFSLDGRYLFFSLVPPADSIKPKPDAVKVDVWSYKDSILQSTQLLALNNPLPEHDAVIDIANRRINQLCQEDETVLARPAAKGDFAVIAGKSSINEYWWKSYPKKPFYLVSLKDASRQPLKIYPRDAFFNFSPAGRYLIYHDAKEQAYFSYNLTSGKVINISKAIPFPLTPLSESMIEGKDSLRIPVVPIGIAGWLPNDAALLIYDNYDIWKVDPSGEKPSMNITNEYGRQHNLKLKVVTPSSHDLPVFRNNELLLLTAFNTQNKHNGFYSKAPNKSGDPELLSMGPYHMYTAAFQAPYSIINNIIPIKAKNKDQWVLIRQTATDAPNYFITRDFKEFIRLTNLQPQEKYNWLTIELISFTQLDSTLSQGILFKPENFDSTKKYPIIYYYYDKLSQYRYQYPEPGFSRGAINIPWFVSRGYLVFTPDIHYTISKTGESVCNSVVGAAQYLSKMPWVNSRAMAITGHSFSGYETNYLVTHSRLFTAAVTAAGVSDFVSAYGGLGVDAMGAASRQEQYEIGQYQLGYPLYTRQNIYTSNSPIFNIDQVTSPLLIIHNKKDPLVPWNQSVELFTGLRRMHKKAWMLQYDEGGHGVQGKEAWDLTKRITQFLDHYLKGAPPPMWMTEGIPARLKGTVTGYQLDISGNKP